MYLNTVSQYTPKPHINYRRFDLLMNCSAVVPRSIHLGGHRGYKTQSTSGREVAVPTQPKQPLADHPAFAEFLQHALQSHSDHNVELLTRAFHFADKAHRHQFRKSGQPYIVHALEVGRILADLNQDTATLVAGILHDTIRHGAATTKQIARHFGNHIANLVEGVTKIKDISFYSREADQAENFRKMLLSMIHDLRVMLIKFCDSLHNMRTLDSLSPAMRKRVARECLDIYAPLAHRLGIARIRWELEDLALKWLEPEAYRAIQRKIHLKRREREAYIEEMRVPLEKMLKEANIRTEITGRPKNFYSIHRKMQIRGKAFEDIYDLLALRILVDTVQECYHVLGMLHSFCTPVMPRFKDFIATPKANMYQSLHTTVIGPRNMMIEVQIRTHAMHQTAEVGIAAHHLYKEGAKKQTEVDQYTYWLRDMLEWQEETSDPQTLIEELKVDLFSHEIYVFTPQGDLIHLPEAATPVDFAFAVHTEIGSRCVGARIDNRMASLSTPLETGQTVEIITSPHQRPHRDWLGFVKSARARSCIRRALREETFKQSVRLGRDMVDRELRQRRKRASNDALKAAAKAFEQSDVDHLFAAISNGEISLGKFFNQLFPKASRDYGDIQKEKKTKNPEALRIHGLHGLMIHYAQCCNPIAGDPAIGIVTRGRGISVHRRGCSNLPHLSSDPGRIVELDWETDLTQTFPTTIQVIGKDRANLLSEITKTMSDLGVAIVGANIKTHREEVDNQFQIEIKNADHLAELLQRLRGIPNITSVYRLETPSDGSS